MSINFSDLSRNMVIELDGQPWQIMDSSGTRCSSARPLPASR